MRTLVLLLLPVTACQCGPKVQSVVEEPWRISPEALEFGPVYLGSSATLVLTIANPSRKNRVVDLGELSPPFSAPPGAVDVPAGETVGLSVSFTPRAVGAATAGLRFDGIHVSLRGEGLAPPVCTAGVCRVARFDPLLGTCLDEPAEEGTDCTATEACFVRAQCHQGTCRGQLDNCDDRDACTLDVCGVTGCGHLDDLLNCPWSANPCEAPSCSPTAGCGTTILPDGTACGARDCRSAEVCIEGRCVVRPAPQVTGCLEVVAGFPGGPGWADGVGETARFGNTSLIPEAGGTVWLVDSTFGLVRRLTPGARVLTIAGRHGQFAHVDGIGAAARFVFPHDGALDDKGNLLVADKRSIRRVSPRGLVTTFVGGATGPARDGIGSQASFENIGPMTMGPDALWLADHQDAGIAFRRVSTRGEVTTELWWPQSRPPRGVVGLVPTPDGFLVTSGPDGLLSIGWDAGVRVLNSELRDRLRMARDGRVVTRRYWPREGIYEIQADGGTTRLVELSSADPIFDFAVATPGAWWVGQYGSNSVSLLTEDGGAERIAGPPLARKPSDGPISDAGLGYVKAMLELGDGTILTAGESVRAVRGGAITTLAQWGGGEPWVSLALLPSGVVAVGGVYRPVPQDAGIPFVRFPAAVSLDVLGDELAWLDRSGALWVSTDDGLDGGVLRCAGGPSWPWQWSEVVHDSRGGFWVIEPSPNGPSIIHLDATCGSVPVVTGANPVALARNASGELLYADADEYEVRRVIGSGQGTVVAQLADFPTGLLVEDGGTILVSVTEAILRIR
ncbi:MAG: hypothetical protein JNJ54_31665 [Myxococcaceae bacterium]|nr:hypothetical protein [Myxococcaceae bacterium]